MSILKTALNHIPLEYKYLVQICDRIGHTYRSVKLSKQEGYDKQGEDESCKVGRSYERQNTQCDIGLLASWTLKSSPISLVWELPANVERTHTY